MGSDLEEIADGVVGRAVAVPESSSLLAATSPGAYLAGGMLHSHPAAGEDGLLPVGPHGGVPSISLSQKPAILVSKETFSSDKIDGSWVLQSVVYPVPAGLQSVGPSEDSSVPVDHRNAIGTEGGPAVEVGALTTLPQKACHKKTKYKLWLYDSFETASGGSDDGSKKHQICRYCGTAINSQNTSVRKKVCDEITWFITWFGSR